MLVNSATKFRIENNKYKEAYMSPNNVAPLSSKFYSTQNYNQDIKRPLKINHSDLSFKGLSLGYQKLNRVYSREEFLRFADKYVGNMGRELLDDITVRFADKTKNLINVEGDKITIFKKTIPHLAWDGIIYPFKILPGDMLNGLVEMLGKVPFLKNWSEGVLAKPFFKNIRQRSKIDAKINSLTGLITYRDVKIDSALESFAKQNGKKVADLTQEEIANITKSVDEKMGSSIFQSELKMFDPKSGNYDTKHERALNRLVSGLPPAIFLANDAYNLSRMMDDDCEAATKEHKTRFKQETSRILTSGYLTLITMGAFQKFINKSKFGIVLTTGVTVLVTEMFSRLSNGKHIKKLTPQEAREENERLHNPEANIKPTVPSKQISSTGTPVSSNEKEKLQKPLLSFDTLMKGSAGVLAIGYGIKGFKNIPAIQKAALKYFENIQANDLEKFEKLGIKDLKLSNAVKTFEEKVIYRPFTQLYKRLTSEVYQVNENKFNNVVQVLRDNGFNKLADKYDEVGKKALKTQNGQQIIDFGKKDKKIKPLVDFVIAPFKFAWNTITLPYWMVDEKLMSVFRKAKPKSVPKDIDALARSFDKISRQAEKLATGKITEAQLKDYIQVNLLKAFNVDSLSSVSNAELSNLAKTAASIATIWFLMTDNYNMVMLKSNGNDKEGAETKFKERFVQEGSRLFYQTLLIDLFNSTFRNQYNSSLLGMSWITLTNTTLGEMLTRSSVGTPLTKHTRTELLEAEAKRENSTGFKKKYFTFMQRLTGKRSIKSYEVAPRSNSKNPSQQPATTSSIIPELNSNKEVIFKNNGGAFAQFTAHM